MDICGEPECLRIGSLIAWRSTARNRVLLAVPTWQQDQWDRYLERIGFIRLELSQRYRSNGHAYWIARKHAPCTHLGAFHTQCLIESLQERVRMRRRTNPALDLPLV